MDIQIETIIQIYKEEIQNLQNENIMLKCQILEMRKEKEKEAVMPNNE